MIKELRLTDGNKLKCDLLNEAGIIVSKYQCGDYTKYVVSIRNFPNADRFFDTTFNSIPDILKAFSDMLMQANIRYVAA